MSPLGVLRPFDRGAPKPSPGAAGSLAPRLSQQARHESVEEQGVSAVPTEHSTKRKDPWLGYESRWPRCRRWIFLHRSEHDPRFPLVVDLANRACDRDDPFFLYPLVESLPIFLL